MTKNISAATLPPLHLTDDEEFELQKLSAELQRETVTKYESYLLEARRVVDQERWKATRSNGGLHAFVERKSALLRDQQATKRSERMYKYSRRSSSPGHVSPQAALAVESQLRRVLVTGLVAGSLDDIMLGASFQDTAGFQAFWTSQNSVMNECAVLATIEGAAVDDPYRFLGVTWFLRSFGRHKTFVKRRDLLTLTDLHLSKLSNGERVGISIAHSIQHQDLRELHEFGVIRSTSSVLRVFRQFDDSHVEVFMTHFLDTKGSTSESFDQRESLGYMLLSPECLMHAGLSKKLRWMIDQRRDTHSQCSGQGWIEPSCSGSADQCELCMRRLGRVFSSSGTSCQVCLKRVCFHCSVTQQLPKADSRSKHASDVCVGCFLQAKTLSSLDVAREQLSPTVNRTPKAIGTSFSS